MSTVPRPPVYRIVLLQVGIALVAGLISLLHSDVAAKSAVLGGLSCAIPNAYFIWKAFRYSGARSTERVVQSFYQGETWKFLLTSLCFIAIFRHVESLNVLALFAGFIAVQLSHVASAKVANL